MEDIEDITIPDVGQVHVTVAMVIGRNEETGNYNTTISALPDPDFSNIRAWGTLLSDAVDHLAKMYAQNTGKPEKAWRKKLIKRFMAEEREKKKDPTRGQITGRMLTDKNALN